MFVRQMFSVCFLLFSVNNNNQAAVTAFSSSSRVFVSTPVTTRRLVEECMTPNPKCVTASTSVNDAMSMLLELGVSGAPVVDDDTGNSLLGIVSNYDFLQKEAFGGALLPMEGTSDTVDRYVNAARRICAKQVSDIMTENPVTIKKKDTMRAAATLMAQKKLNRLPVVDDSGALVGILTSSDVMRDLVHIVRSLPEGHDEDSATP